MNVNRRILVWAFPLLLVSLCACDKVHKRLAELDFNQGVKKYYEGNMAGASNYFSGAIAQNTNYVDAYVYRGNILIGCSNFTLALQDFDRALALRPQDATILTDRAAALCRMERFSEAATNCTEAIQVNPNADYAYKYRALSRVYLRDWNGAVEDLNESEKLSANDPWTYSTRAGLRNLRREYEGAVDDATKAVELMRTNAEPYRARGYARAGLRDFENALADFNEANRLSLHDPDTLSGRGLVKMQQGDLKGAEEDLADAARISPTNFTVMMGLASVKKKSGDSEGAAAMLTNIVKTAPKYNLPEAFEFLGFVQSDMWQFAPALENYRKAVEIDSTMYYAHLGIWMLRARMGERDEATKDLRASMKAWDGDERRKWGLCIGRFLTGETTESNLLTQATEVVARVTDEPSQKCEALYYAGMKRLIDGDKIGATGFFEKCVASGEDNEAQYYSAKAELQKLKTL